MTELEIRQAFPNLEHYEVDLGLHSFYFREKKHGFDGLLPELVNRIYHEEEVLFVFGCLLRLTSSKSHKFSPALIAITSNYDLVSAIVKKNNMEFDPRRVKLIDIVELKPESLGMYKIILDLSRDSNFAVLMSAGPKPLFLNIIDKFNYYINLAKRIERDSKQTSLELEKESKRQEQINLFLKIYEISQKKGSYPSLLSNLLGIKNFDIRSQLSTLYNELIGSRKAHFSRNPEYESKLIVYPEIIQYFTIIETDKILIENGLNEYSINEVSRSTHPSISSGEYFYSFDDSDNLLMIKAPYRHVYTSKGNYIFFDSELYQNNELIVIPKSEIISYKLFGTELMRSNVKTNNTLGVVEGKTDTSASKYQPPSIIGTALTTFLFGSSYTILKGVGRAVHQQTNVLGNKLDNLGDKMEDIVDAINSISISTDHQIIDTSRVQIVLSNRRDLEIDGINIYYDLNRMYPELGNDSSNAKTLSESQGSVKQASMTDEIIKLKNMLDDGIIDEEEFKEMKKKLISKI